MTVLWAGIGSLIEHLDEGTAVGKVDRRLAEWLVGRRTPTRNTFSLIGSMLSETAIKVVLTAIVCLVLLRVLRRWFEPLVIAVSLIVEAMIFMTVTLIVGRPRPDVPRLDGSPVSSSFPSGHVAAAACYGAMAVVVFWHTRRVWLRALAVLLTLVVPVIVGLARMYRGMHYLTDVVSGAIIGATCVVAVVWILKRAEARRLKEASLGVVKEGPAVLSVPGSTTHPHSAAVPAHTAVNPAAPPGPARA